MFDLIAPTGPPSTARYTRTRRPGEFGPLEGHLLLRGVARVYVQRWDDPLDGAPLGRLRVGLPPDGGAGTASALLVVDVLAPEAARLAPRALPPSACRWTDDHGRHSAYTTTPTPDMYTAPEQVRHSE